jgi:ribosomal protein S18 acetylase RimI-like enzyme
MPSFPITYERLSWTDYASAKALFRRAFALSEWGRWTDSWNNRNKTRGCWVARYHGAVVGVCIVSTDNHINYIAVDPDYQGYKIGSGLLTRIMRDLADTRSLRLTTAADERLLAWYGRFGFRPYELVYSADGTYLGAHMICRNRCRSAIKK